MRRFTVPDVSPVTPLPHVDLVLTTALQPMLLSFPIPPRKLCLLDILRDLLRAQLVGAPV